MRRLGDIMHDLEEIIASGYEGREESSIIDSFNILKSHFPKNREEYCDDKFSSEFRFEPSRKRTASRKKSPTLKKLHRVIRELAIEHDCQWAEVLALVHGYVKAHTYNLKYFFEYGPQTRKNVSKIDKRGKSGK